MSRKPTCEELEQRVKELERKLDASKKIGQDLLIEKEFSESVINCLPGIFFVLDKNNRFYRWNENLGKVTGYSDQEISRMNPLDFIDEGDKKKTADKINEVFVKGRSYVELEMVSKRGNKTPYYFTGVRTTIGNISYLMGIGIDITERKQADEVLRESRERFRSLAEITSDWIWEVDKNGCYTYVNPKIYDMLGYSPEEVLGRTPFDLMPAEEAERLVEIFSQIRAAQQPFECLENVNLHKDGYPVVIETSGVPIFNINEECVGYRGIDRDITQRKRAEKELQQARDELEERVEERTRELKAQKINLEEANIALQILLDKRKEDKKEMEDNILVNVKELITPYFERIKQSRLDDKQKALLSIMESNLNEIISPFFRKMPLKYLSLTPTEIQIANLIRHGRNSKEISLLMGLSLRTIYNHRKNIRKKIGIEDRNTDLRSQLKSIF